MDVNSAALTCAFSRLFGGEGRAPSDDKFRMNKLIAAIVDDDASAVKTLLQADVGLATLLIQTNPSGNPSGVA
jgi:hypothetical protein